MSALDIFGRDAHQNRGFFGGLNKRFTQYRTYRQTLTELETLSDRELADLGIHRAQLRGIAYKAAYDG